MESITGHCVDSDILIDYLRGVAKARRFLLQASKRTALYISVVSIAEIYSGKETRQPKKRERIETFLQNFVTIEVDWGIAERAGELRRDYQKPFADAIVAASAITNKLRLVTRNTKHFRGIKGLKLLRPYY